MKLQFNVMPRRRSMTFQDQSILWKKIFSLSTSSGCGASWDAPYSMITLSWTVRLICNNKQTRYLIQVVFKLDVSYQNQAEMFDAQIVKNLRCNCYSHPISMDDVVGMGIRRATFC